MLSLTPGYNDRALSPPNRAPEGYVWDPREGDFKESTGCRRRHDVPVQINIRHYFELRGILIPRCSWAEVCRSVVDKKSTIKSCISDWCKWCCWRLDMAGVLKELKRK